MPRFDGKTVLVTGASSGIGFASAKRFAAEGARVVCTARNKERLEAAVAELPSGNHLALAFDAADEAGWTPRRLSLRRKAWRWMRRFWRQGSTPSIRCN